MGKLGKCIQLIIIMCNSIFQHICYFLVVYLAAESEMKLGQAVTQFLMMLE
jgi:hypothetical protein